MTTQAQHERQVLETTIGNDILDTVLVAFGFSRAVLTSNRSPENVIARARIYRAMRACRHPDTAQLSLRTIARVCGTTPATVLMRLQKLPPVPAWRFEAGPGVTE